MMALLARASRDGALRDGAEPLPSPAAVAATVPPSAKLAAAEDALRALLARRAEIRDAIDAIIGERESESAGRRVTVGRQLAELGRQREAVELEIRDARTGIAPHRARHGKAVADALAWRIAPACSAGLAALDALRAAASEVTAIGEAVNRAGAIGPWGDGYRAPVLLPEGLGHVEAALRSAARRAAQ
jgi:hypothetical protein